MAFKINIVGEDTHTPGEKAAFERHLVEEVSAFVLRLSERREVQVKEGSVVTDSESREFAPVAEAVSEDA